MKIIEIKSLSIPDIKIIRFERFKDQRGYFTEPFRKSDFQNNPQTPFFKNIEFFQINESFSYKGVCRGLHFQWNPFMGKLVRTISGRMVDMVLDIRKGSPTYGKLTAYDMPAKTNDDFNEWIWVPAGFAHGNFFTEETRIEYLCSGEYSPGCEAGISPLTKDIDWSLCPVEIKKEFETIIIPSGILSEKDKNGMPLSVWENDERSQNFIYGKC